MTAVEWLYDKLKLSLPEDVEGFYYQALEMEKQQIKQTVLNLLHHKLGHDDTARWLAERLEVGEIDVNDL